MPNETLAPDAVLDSTNYTTLNLTDIDEDPGSPDGVFGTWDGNGNTIARLSFPSPSGNLTTGAGLQTFRVEFRRSSAGGALTPWALQLYEGGTLVATLNTGTDAAAGGETASGSFDASLLSDGSGAGVECRLIQTSGGTGGGRKGLELGAVA
jgi:hypothetical protein